MNSFNTVQQLVDTESAIGNKLIHLLSELRGFKFVATLVIESKKYKVMMQQNMKLFILNEKQKQLLMRVTLMMYLNQSIL